MEKLIIFGIALVIGYLSLVPDKPVRIFPTQDNSNKIADKPVVKKITFIIRNCDPN